MSLPDLSFLTLPKLVGTSVPPPSDDGPSVSADEEDEDEEEGRDAGELDDEEREEDEPPISPRARIRDQKGALYTPEEEADLRRCLKEHALVDDAVARFNQLHPNCYAVTTYLRKNKDRFKKDRPDPVLGGKWSDEEDAALVQILAQPAVSRRAGFIKFSKEFPTRTHKSAEGRYALQREWFEQAIEAKQKNLPGPPALSTQPDRPPSRYTPVASTSKFNSAPKSPLAVAPKTKPGPKPKPKAHPPPVAAPSTTLPPAKRAKIEKKPRQPRQAPPPPSVAPSRVSTRVARAPKRWDSPPPSSAAPTTASRGLPPPPSSISPPTFAPSAINAEEQAVKSIGKGKRRA